MPSRIFPGRPTRPDWNNLDCQKRNALPQHAYLVQFPDQATCEAALDNNRRYLSPSVMLLNGTWDYKLFESITQLPENIFAYRSGFETITVPSAYDVSKQLHRRPSGAGGWPFAVNPPYIPEDIPVGVYHRSIQLNPDWTSLRKRLVLQGVQSACHVVMNGRIAGYAQQGLLTHEFDITQLIHDGINELFILVYPFSAASYLDDPQAPYRSGLVGDIYLEAIAANSIYDLVVQTRQTDRATQTWQLDLAVTVLSYRVALDTLSVQLTLKKDQELCCTAQIDLAVLADAAGQSGQTPTELPDPFDKAVQRVLTGQITLDLMQVQPWSDEQPDLYDLFLSVLDSSGREYSAVHQVIGFRQVEKAAQGWTLNGKPLKLYAVRYDPPLDQFPAQLNLHHYVRELRLIRQQHLNAIILSRTPLDPLFYELCSYLGLFVIQDHHCSQPVFTLLGLESTLAGDTPQAAGKTSAESPGPVLPAKRWLNLAATRFQNLLVRDCNQPALIGHLLDEWAKSGQHQMTSAQRDFVQGQPLSTLADSQRLPDAFWLCDRNFDLTAGGPAGLSDLIAQVQQDTHWAGVILGRWVDLRAFLHSHKDRQFAAAAATIRAAVSPLTIEPVHLTVGQIKILSNQRSQVFDNYRLHWQILRNGVMYEAGEVDGPAVLPGQTIDLTLNYGPVIFDSDADYQLVVTVHQILATLWQPADAVLMRWSQPIQPSRQLRDPYLSVLRPSIRPTQHKLRLELDRHLLVVSGPRFWVVFNRISGMLESWRCGDQEWLSFAQTTSAAHRGSFGAPLIFWRPLLKQDLCYQELWLKLGLDQLVQTVLSVEHTCDGTTAEIQLTCGYGPLGKKPVIRARTVYRITVLGQVEIDVSLIDAGPLDPGLLPRLGFRLFLRKQYDRVIWSGLGPDPAWPANDSLNYPGQFVEPLARLMTSAQSPVKEYAPHVQTRWLAMADDKGQGLLIENSQLFSFQARDVVLEDLQDHAVDARNLHQNLVEVCLDFYYKPAGPVERPDEPAQQTPFGGRLVLTPVTGFLPA